MKSSLLVLLPAFVFGLFFATEAQAQIAKKKEVSDTYTLVDVDERLSIIPTEDIGAARKQLEEQYKLALEAYKAAKKRDPLAKVDMPERQKLSIVKTNLKDEEAAQIALERETSRRAAAKAGGDGGKKKLKDR